MHIIFTFMMGLTNPALADGACCLEDYSCTTESADVCDRYGGAYYDAASCSDVFAECEGLADTTGDPTGASDAGTTDGGGTDGGDTDAGGTDEPELGACCVDGTCSELDYDTCKDLLGTWWPGSGCGDPWVE